ETRYTDALNETREVSQDTLSALIGVFGLSSDPQRARDELEEQCRALPLGLEAVHVVGAEDTRPELALRLPSNCRQGSWTCQLENRGERGGRGLVDSVPNARRFAMPLPGGLPLGYHHLDLEVGKISAQTSLIVAPDRCFLPAQLGPGARSWGLSCQLYGLQ